MTVVGMASALAVGSDRYELSVNGRNRTYRLYRPSSLNAPTPAPLVVVLHGGFGTGAQAETAYGWDAEADRKGFLVAYPDGVRRSWNAGGACCGTGAKAKIDDVRFLTAVITDISNRTAIDPKRVYLTGISNGAALAYRYACEGPYPLAAIGPVAGSLAFSCLNPPAVSVMEIHGLADAHIPLAGGYGPKGFAKVAWLPVEQVMNQFRFAAGCSAPALSQNGPVHTAQSFCPGRREVTLITIDGAGHQWPGGKKPGLLAGLLLALDPPSQALDATATLWQFFAQHRAP